MLTREMRTGIRAIGLTLVALAVGSCIGDNLPTSPEEEAPAPDGGSFAVTCEANVTTKRLACGPRGSGSPQLTEGSAAVIFGGQNLFVTLASSNITVGANTFAADVTITNLIPQPMGTPDNCCSVTNVNIFFHTGPTNGVSVSNANGTDNFTAPGQPFHAYLPNTHFLGGVSNTLETNETSASKNWQFDTSGITDSTFQFTVLVSADVPFPNGWVEIDSTSGTVEAGGTETQTATVKDVVGRTVAGRTLTWTALDPSIVTIGSSTGLASGIGGNHQAGRIVIASDGPEASDTASVKIYELLSARVPLTTTFISGGERLYKFTVPGGGSIVAGNFALTGPIASRIRSGGMGARLPEPEETTTGNGSLLLGAAPMVTSVVGFSVDSISTTTGGGPAGDANLYVRFGAPPSIPDGLWDCRPFFFGSRERCSADNPATGDWFVTIDSADDFTDAEVNADFATTQAGYDIELVFLDNGLTAAQQQAVSDAVANWEAVVVGDLSPAAAMAFTCGAGGQPINVATDDLYITVVVEFIDGASGTLAQAGPCFLRTTGNENPRLPIAGRVIIDSADLAGTLSDLAVFEAVVLHELGHALGIGTLWDASQFGLLTGEGGADPTFNGTLTIAAYASVGGPASTEPPVELTVEGHWREDPFDSELMTPIIDPGMELSLVTAQSLADEGYTVNTAAVDAYTLPGGMIVLEGREASAGIPLGDDVLKGPIYTWDSSGPLVRIP